MSTIYINTRQSEEHRIVIAKDGELTGFEQDIVGWENRKGDIYKAVVTRIEEGLDAAFVDFGESKNGFLPLKNVPPDLPGASGGERKLAEGDSVLVQIKKDHVGDKGAGMTANISLAGCYLVLMPNTKKDKAMMSKSIGGRDRRKIMEALDGLNVPDGMSVIVRTAGIGRPPEDLRWDLESYLLKLWRAVENAAQNNRGPLLIYRENNLLLRAVRDYYRPGEDEIYCDDADSFQELKNFMEIISPDNAGCVHYYEGGGAMVPDPVERQIDAIYRREIKTASGARVVFDVAEAMVAVDVNSAQMRGESDIETTALRANKDAAEVVARHLRLRDMSGLIVVDFIDMTAEENRRALEEHFIALLRKDRARVQWTPLSRFGMMELSRQRLSRPVEESQSVVCQTCRGTGRQRRPESFALRLLRQIRSMLPDEEAGALVVHAPSDAAVYLLNEKRVELRRLEDEYDCEILVAPIADMYPPDFTVRKIGREGRVGVSYQARGGGGDKIRAEEMKRRFEKRSAGTKVPLIQTVMPEERDSDGSFERLWKSLANIFRPFSSADDKKRGGARRRAATKRRQQQRREVRSAGTQKPAAAPSSASAENGNNGGKKQRGGRRRRAARRKQGADAAAVSNNARAESDSRNESEVSPPAAADKPERKSEQSEAAARRPAEAKSPAESAPESAPKSDIAAAESAPPAADDSGNSRESETAAEEMLPLTARLAQRYGKSEDDIRAALAATGDAGSECIGEIPPELIARLNAHFRRAAPPPAEEETMQKVETSGAPETPAEFQNEVRELAAEEPSADNRPPSAASSADLRQVETNRE